MFREQYLLSFLCAWVDVYAFFCFCLFYSPGWAFWLEQGSVTELDDVRKVFADGDISGVVVALGGKTADVGKTMLTDGKCLFDATLRVVS